jgi:hypothetical protein
MSDSASLARAASLEPSFQDYRRRDCIDCGLHSAAAYTAGESTLGLEAGQALVIKFDLDFERVSEACGKITDMAGHRPLAAVHIDREAHDDAF